MNEIDAQLALGVELFNRGEFFEAHEAMEDAMNMLDDDTADWDFYLGLLRASVANHKLADGELSSARLHLRAALKFLAPYPDRHRGIKLREFRSALTAELARLDSALAQSPKHAMVCLHHHPIAMGSRWLDSVGLAQPEDFWSVIDAHTNVRAVVWGHVHQAFDGSRGAVRLFATPSTGAQFLPKSDRYAVDSAPPAYRSFELHADGRIDSQVHWVESAQLRQTAS